MTVDVAQPVDLDCIEAEITVLSAVYGVFWGRVSTHLEAMRFIERGRH